jgi:hypothetical protein
LVALSAYTLGRAGNEPSAARDVARLRDLASTEYVSPYYLATAHMGTGATAAALAELEVAIQQRCPQIAYLGTDPVFDPIRTDRSFPRMLRDAALSAAPTTH